MPKRSIPVQVVNLRTLVFWALAVYLLVRFVDTISVTAFLFAVAFFFAALLDPPIRWLDRHGLSRGMSVALIALLVLAAAGLAIYLAVPPLAREANAQVAQVPQYTQQLQQRLDRLLAQYPSLRAQIDPAEIGDKAVSLGQNVLPKLGQFSFSFLSGFASLFLILILTLYTLADPKPLVRGVIIAFPRSYRRMALRVMARIDQQLRAWARATFWMMLIVGTMCGLGLWALGVQSALLFALIAGVGEAIPTIGPILSAIPPFLVTLAGDPVKANWVLVLYLAVQQIENNLLVPRIMASNLNLHPVSVLFFVIVMGSQFGPLGILIATPLCAILKVIYQEVYMPAVNPGGKPPPRLTLRPFALTPGPSPTLRERGRQEQK